MESDIMPLHSSSPPPLDDDGDGEAGSEEDDFGDFGGFEASCSPPDSTVSPSSLRRPCAATKPATHQPKCSFNHPVEQSQPTSSVDSVSCRGQIDVGGPDCNTESYVHLTNGYSERDHHSGTHIVSAVGVCSPREETGFADFTVFTEQAEHPWCCGFSPTSSKELWEGTNSSNGLREQICDPGQGVVMDSEPRSHCACEGKGNVCTKVKHCEKRDVALMQTSQDRHQPQGAAAALDFTPEEPHSVREEVGECGGSWRERRRFNYLPTKEEQEGGESDEDQERSISAIPQTFSVCDSEDQASFCDDFSLECPSADLEPNVSSLVSPEDQTDWDQTDDEEENELGNCDKDFHFRDQSSTQETSATSNQPQPGTHFKDCSLEHHGNQGCVQTDAAAVQSLGNLPPSDSFADFCSAPTQEGGNESWVEFREPVSSLQSDGEAEEEQDKPGSYGISRRSSCKVSLSCRVQQLLLSSFPDVEVPAVGGEEEVLSLGALLHLPESKEEEEEQEEKEEEEEIPELCPTSQWVRREGWWPHQDLHDAVGLQFQWGGSHTNRTLLRCLSVETRNIVFIGSKKQPVVVPAFASSLGMLEPTKDSEPAVVVTVQVPPGHGDTPDPSAGSTQGALPSSQLDWSSRGLNSSSQDDCSALNLDYFGPEEESRSSSSCSNSPPPGVDRELYELTMSKLETSADGGLVEDTLNRLMSTAEKTSTSVRKPQQDEELSVEAGTVISALPTLAFMQARVLMFPVILQPKEN